MLIGSILNNDIFRNAVIAFIKFLSKYSLETDNEDLWQAEMFK